MNGIVIFGLSLAVLAVFIASLWYLLQTVRIIWGYSSLLAIAALFFSPLVQVVCYFIIEESFDGYERRLFKKYFLSLGAIFVLGFAAFALVPAVEPRPPMDAMADQTAEGEPWEWDIRAETLEESLFGVLRALKE